MSKRNTNRKPRTLAEDIADVKRRVTDAEQASRFIRSVQDGQLAKADRLRALAANVVRSRARRATNGYAREVADGALAALVDFLRDECRATAFKPVFRVAKPNKTKKANA